MTTHERHHFERGLIAYHIAMYRDGRTDVATAARLSGRRRGSKARRAYMLGYLRAARIGRNGGIIPTTAAALAA
jgi:hypothetical protein